MSLLEMFLSPYLKGNSATVIILKGTTMALHSLNKGVLSTLCGAGFVPVHVEKTFFLSTKSLGKVDMQKSQNKMIVDIMYHVQRKSRWTPQRGTEKFLI